MNETKHTRHILHAWSSTVSVHNTDCITRCFSLCLYAFFLCLLSFVLSFLVDYVLPFNVKRSFTLYNSTTIRYNNIQTHRNPPNTFRPLQVNKGEAFNKENITMVFMLNVCNGRITIQKLQWEKDWGQNRMSIAVVVWLPNLYLLCFTCVYCVFTRIYCVFTCIYCVLYCLYCGFILFRLCVVILICY
jgi:hypothetical protein